MLQETRDWKAKWTQSKQNDGIYKDKIEINESENRKKWRNLNETKLTSVKNSITLINLQQ